MNDETEALLQQTADAVRAAGGRLLERFPAAAPRPDTRAALHELLEDNDRASLEVLRPALQAARPAAGWVDEEFDAGPLPDGEWWVADPAEGNVNHAHGLAGWAVTATLVRDNRPVLTAVHEPLSGDTYTAVHGGGAHRNGRRLSTSAKTNLHDAIATTSQARPDEPEDVLERMGRGISVMMRRALVVRMFVPAALHLTDLAAGRVDVFWQQRTTRADTCAGALLVAEAGGVVTDLDGRPWNLGGTGFLAAAGGVHGAALEALHTVG